LTLKAGAHFLYLTNSDDASLEPRASLRYEMTDKQAMTFGYGLHSQMQTVGIYEAQVRQDDGTITKPNQSIGFNKSHHFVLGYDRSLTKHLHVKTEAYYQQLFNIAVINNINSPISTLVIEEGYLTQPLVNEGKGRNMGLELTLEQFMHRNMYFLFSGSLYDSKYTALDGVWRNTRFNGRGAMSLTGGKEWDWRKGRTFGVNIKAIFAGGFRITPVDVEQSNAEGRPIYLIDQAYAEQLPAYFRTDLRISLKRNRPRSTSTIAIDVQNVTNRENVGGRFYDPRAGAMREWYQLPLLPVLSYRVEF